MERENKRAKFIKKSKFGTTEALKSRDMMLGYIARSIDSLDEAIHLLTEKLEDLYSSYFPELKLEDKRKYAEIILAFDRKNPDAASIEAMVGAPKAADLVARAQKSLGADLKEEDMAMIREFARNVVEMHKLRDAMTGHQEKMAEEVCPNIKYVSNAAIAAKLIAHTGSLRKLALLPASTIQVLGAEKALFKHLRSKGRIGSPKHGIIFQYPAIGTAPKHQRGKIARILATKIAIASKADAFSHNFIAEQLKKDLDARLEEIRAAPAPQRGPKPAAGNAQPGTQNPAQGGNPQPPKAGNAPHGHHGGQFRRR
ncbi:putative NOP5 family protein [uncultured archaeon]|nr:putative NOP5 family protein [uncultured archaeon]